MLPDKFIDEGITMIINMWNRIIGKNILFEKIELLELELNETNHDISKFKNHLKQKNLQINELTNELSQFNQSYKKLENRLNDIKQQAQQLIKQKNYQIHELIDKLNQINTSHEKLESQLNDIKQQAQQLIKQKNCQIHELTDKLNQVNTSYNKLENQLVHVNQQLSEIELRQSLVGKLLSATNQNPHVAQYFHLLNHDFLAFANEEDSLQDEAAALLELQAIGDELKVIGSYPEFYKKRSVAIAGGFSAGKSEFISSLFQDKSVRLPIGIEPTTAIPTYALNGSQNGLLGCSQNGGVINLLDIEPNFQHKLSHNFIRSFGFNLKSIMPFVFLTTPMQYEHLCFIDTPGYNPSDVADGHTSEDVKTAEEFVQNAEALLWLIGLDSNGTIAKSDLDFLDKVHQNIGKPLYIVLNKADLKPQHEIEDIMDEIVDTLDDYDIEIVGISAYSSISKLEYLYQKQSLFDFLNELDTPSDKQHLILQRLYQIDEKYQRAILQTMKESKQISDTLSGLKWDLLQEGFDDLGSGIHEKISKMNALFVSKHKEEMLQKLAHVVKQMEDTINQLFGHKSDLHRKVWTIEEIELSDKFARLTQKDVFPDELENINSDRLQNEQLEKEILPEEVLKVFWNSSSPYRVGKT